MFTAALYFLKSAKLNLGPGAWGQVLFALALAGTAIAIWRWRRYGALLLLWLPLAFYSLSIAYGSVPIFLPVWYPFSYYNVRYGLELLPVFSVFPALLLALRIDGYTQCEGEDCALDRHGAFVHSQLRGRLSRVADYLA